MSGDVVRLKTGLLFDPLRFQGEMWLCCMVRSLCDTGCIVIPFDVLQGYEHMPGAMQYLVETGVVKMEGAGDREAVILSWVEDLEGDQLFEKVKLVQEAGC